MAPKATGAVLAVSASTAAFSGLKPRAISMTEVTATGVPNPASASMRAPNEKAMMIAWMRWSSLTRANERRSTSKCPVATVIWKTQIALITIQRIGKKPNAAPSDPASSVCPIGMPYTATATTMAKARDDQRGHPGGHPQHAEQYEQHQQRQRGDQGTPGERMGDGIKNLLVHGDHLRRCVIFLVVDDFYPVSVLCKGPCKDLCKDPE